MYSQSQNDIISVVAGHQLNVNKNHYFCNHQQHKYCFRPSMMREAQQMTDQHDKIKIINITCRKGPLHEMRTWWTHREKMISKLPVAIPAAVPNMGVIYRPRPERQEIIVIITKAHGCSTQFVTVNHYSRQRRNNYYHNSSRHRSQRKHKKISSTLCSLVGDFANHFSYLAEFESLFNQWNSNEIRRW